MIEEQETTRDKEAEQKHVARVLANSCKASLARTGSPNSEMAARFLNAAILRMSERFPELASDISDLASLLEDAPAEGDTQSFPEKYGQSLSKILLSKYSPQELERINLAHMIRTHGWRPLSETLAYSTNGNEVQIHVPVSYVERSNMEMGTSMQKGLGAFVKELEQNPILESVETIASISFIIYRFRDSFVRDGWKITSTDDQRGLAKAKISRREFLEAYRKYAE
jgi:hypothetical protein